ncbi:MAG: competence/damage-inducible protein A [Cyclobacteriaceae bacterium]
MEELLAEIITIGDEILIGQIVDTNSAWMGDQLNQIGMKVRQITTIGDGKQEIVTALDNALERNDMVFITGGLGPTKDDITKHTLADYFNTPLVRDQFTYDKLEKYLLDRGKDFNELNASQALLPESCTIIDNQLGTAQGMWFEHQEKIVMSMPGVPYEMKGLMTTSVLPKIANHFSLPAIVHRTIRTVGKGESDLALKIEDLEEALPAHIKLAYLPSFSQVRLRLSAFGKEKEVLKEEIASYEKQLLTRIGDYVFGFDDTTLAQAVGALLKEKGKTIATAESCTGGYVAHQITSVAGSSNYFRGSVIAYDNEVKKDFLSVREEDLQQHGAVSEQVVSQMAKAVRERLGTDIGVATSGIAGPSGGTKSKPVGTIWIALSDGKTTTAKRLLLSTSRENNIKRTTIYVLDSVRRYLNQL